MNVILRSFRSTVYAPIFCVMPPASPAATFEQRSFTVVDVTEHGDDRRTRRHHLRTIFFLLDGDFFAGFLNDSVEAELLRNANGNIARDVLVDRRHRTHLDEFGDD